MDIFFIFVGYIIKEWNYQVVLYAYYKNHPKFYPIYRQYCNYKPK